MDRRRLCSGALLLALALLAAGCRSDDAGDPEGDGVDVTEGATDAVDEGGDDAADAGVASGGEGRFSVYICEPESLIPTNTNETCGAEVLNALFSPLVVYDPETNEALWGDDAPRAMAADITSDDNRTWTVTLKEGWTFHDGTPVTAQNFVDSWNFGALSTNAQGNSYFFGPDVLNIVGFEDLQGEVDDEGNEVAAPAATEMSGLRAVDDLTLEVELAAPFSGFPTVLGYTAFYPMHPQVHEDPEAYNEAPIGNGPFVLDRPWQHDQVISVSRYDDYAGAPAAAGGVDFTIYAEINTAYNDLLAGNLDILEQVPPEQLANAQQQLGDRYLESPSSSFTFIGFPLYDERFADPDLRKAFSMAIDREGIISAIFDNTRTPADALVSPVVDGYREGACGEYCTFDPERAAELLEEAGGWEGTLTLWFNSGAGHEEWMEAVANQLRQNLGIADIQFESLQFADFQGRLQAFEVTGPYRSGWAMDFPLAVNYLAPLHASTGSSNYTTYANPDVDRLIQEGLAADSVDEAIERWNEAEDLIIEDLPIIPMWFGLNQTGYSERVEGVVIDGFTLINTADITVTG